MTGYMRYEGRVRHLIGRAIMRFDGIFFAAAYGNDYFLMISSEAVVVHASAASRGVTLFSRVAAWLHPAIFRAIYTATA